MHTAHRFSSAVGTALAVAALFLVSHPAVNADNAQTLAGTWVVSIEAIPGVFVPALHTYHVDGTITSSDVLSFGGLPGVPIRMTALHGVWERTGPSSFATTNLTLVYDAATSVLAGFGRGRATVSMANGRADYASGTAVIEFLSCPTPYTCPDPQADGAAWVPFPNFPPSLAVTATRLRMVR